MSTSIACIVGFGKIGRLHAALLGGMGWRVVTVDPKGPNEGASANRATFAAVDSIPPTMVADIRLWVICAPTDLHLDCLKQVVRVAPEGRVVVEKPACNSDQIDEFEELLHAHPRLRLTINEQYAFSRLGARMREAVRRAKAPLEDVYIEFTKNRSADRAGGRFVDRDYGILGYEWTHILTLLSTIIDHGVWRRYLDVHPRQISPSDASSWPHLGRYQEETVLGKGLPTIRLYTAIDGTINWLQPSIAQEARPDDIRAARISERSQFRYRVVSLRAGNVRATAQFPPLATAGRSELVANVGRLVLERSGQATEVRYFPENIMEVSLLFAVHMCDQAPRTLREMVGTHLAKLRRFSMLKMQSIAAFGDLHSDGGTDSRVRTGFARIGHRAISSAVL